MENDFLSFFSAVCLMIAGLEEGENPSGGKYAA
jgi:hypothetical protein